VLEGRRSVSELPIPAVRNAPAATHPCELYAHTVAPIPVRTQFHHTKPVFLQNRLYGKILYPAELWVCGLCHDALTETIDWLLGEGRQPNPMPGRNALSCAQQTVNWYRSEQKRLGLT
jgi:hypothetical protein